MNLLRGKSNGFLLFILFSSIFLWNAEHSRGEDRYSDWSSSSLRLTIKMTKKVFAVGEPVDGTILVENTYANTIPAVFHITLFHEDETVAELTTAIKQIPMGTNKFSLKEFGIPEFSNEPKAEGRWRIRILQQNVNDSYAAGATIRIVGPQDPQK